MNNIVGDCIVTAVMILTFYGLIWLLVKIEVHKNKNKGF